MGVSLEMYRARIGTFCAKSLRIKETFCPVELEEPQDPDLEPQRLCTPTWKQSSIILVILILSFVCQSVILLKGTENSTNQNISFTNQLSNPGNLTDGISFHNSIMSKTCLQTLLLISGIEPNPGPDMDAEILATLCDDAPDSTIRDCLREYRRELHTTQLKSAFMKYDKDILVNTMNYLNAPGQEKYTKDFVSHNIIIRIQNLFVDNCRYCKEKYHIKRLDVELLKCAVCGQGAHNKCIADILGVDEQLLIDLGQKEAAKRINPAQLAGLHYMCETCENDFIPSEDTGMLKKELKELKTRHQAYLVDVALKMIEGAGAYL